jgi:hypothetical protein
MITGQPQTKLVRRPYLRNRPGMAVCVFGLSYSGGGDKRITKVRSLKCETISEKLNPKGLECCSSQRVLAL